jgi:hypothetical protein
VIILTNAGTDKMQIVTSAAVTVDVHASWVDLASGSVTPGRTNTAITTAATTDVVATPAASTQRNVKTLNVRNKHASSSVDVTVVFDQNGTDFELHKATLAAGEVLEYIEGIGWFKVSVATPNLQMLGLTADQSNATTTATEVTGLTLATGTGTFMFEYRILCQTSATTTTPKYAVNYDGTVTAFVYWVEAVSATTTAADGVIDQDVSTVTGGLINVNAARAKSTTALTAFVSLDTVNADVLYKISGLMVVTVAGNLELWHGSENAVSTTVKAGSSLLVAKTV